MNTQFLSAVTALADSIASRAPLPLDIVPEIRALGAEVVFATSPERAPGFESCPLAVTLGDTGGYCVKLYRDPNAPPFLTRRERFTLAHEWAHVALDQFSGWRPDSRREHFRREAWCNSIAAHLLVPERVRLTPGLEHPVGALRVTARIREECAVSWPVAGLRLAEASSRIVIAELKAGSRRSGQEILRVVWSAGAVELFDVARGRYLDSEHTWFQLCRSSTGPSLLSRADSGDVRWALIRSRADTKRYFAWASLSDGSSLRPQPDAPMAGFAQLSFLLQN